MPKRHPRSRFCKGALEVTKWCKNTQNMSFRLNVVDWMCFGRETRKKFGWPGLLPKRHPRNRFSNGALAANKWCETTKNVSFGPKVVDWLHFGQNPNPCQNGILGPDLAKLHYAATKWCETTQNMSFGPNVVDWMRFGGKSRKKIRCPELVPKWHPRTRLSQRCTCGNQMVRNHPKHESWT